MIKLLDLVKEYKRKYPLSIAWRLKKNSNVINMHLNEGEEVIYAFAAQDNDSVVNIFNTCIVALTNERMIVGYKRVIFGYKFISITPDLYNDLTIKNGIIWAKLIIDTVREQIVLSNIQSRATIEIETKITEFMLEKKSEFKK